LTHLFARIYYLDGRLDVRATLFVGIINPLRIPRIFWDVIEGIRWGYSLKEIVYWIKTETIPDRELER